MTIKVSKPEVDIREKLAELDKPSGIKGNQVLRAETADEVRDAIGARGRKNLIINGNFQVSQRGDFTTPYNITNGSEFTVDRWNFYLGSPNKDCEFITQDVTLPNGTTTTSAKLTALEESNNYFHIIQHIEGNKSYNGKTITLSCWVRTDQPNNAIRVCDGVGCYVIGSSIPNDGNWHYISTSHTLPHNGANIQVHPAFPSTYSTINVGGYIEFAEMQVELGSVATEFEHRSYGEELALCQRYFQTYPDTLQQHISVGTNQWSQVNIFLPITMRVTPTASYSITHTNASSGSVSVTHNGKIARFAWASTTSGGQSGINISSLTFDAEL